MTSTNIRYLERVEISDFRAYGEGFTLTLPAGPGVTLIYGPNGLGKTTFFDALEWCLTGDIQRFDEYRRGSAKRHEEHLTRIGARTKDSHRVSLYFSGAEPLDRGPGMEPTIQEVVALLKEPHWPGVSDVGLYLSLTHFLGQSAKQRFSVKPPSEQWEALQGPAGVDRVNVIRDKLAGHGARQAFTRQIRTAEVDVVKAREALGEARTLIAQLDQVRSLGRVRESLSPSDLVDACIRLVQSLGVPGGHPVVLESAPPDAWLDRTGEIVREMRRRVQDDLELARSLEVLAHEIQAAQVERASLEEMITSEAAKRDELERSSSLLSERLTMTRAAIAAARVDLTQAETQLATDDRILAAREDLTRSASREAVLREEIARLEQQLATMAESYSHLEAEAHELALRASAQDIAARELDQLRAAAALAAEIDHELQGAEREIGTASVEDILGTLVSRRNVLAAETRTLNSQISSLESELAKIDERLGTITALVVELRRLLEEGDERCPVCATEFANGELLARVQALPESAPTSVRSAGEQLAAARVRLATTVREAEVVAQEISRLEFGRQALARATERKRELLAHVLELKPDAQVLTLADIQSITAAAEQEIDSAGIAALGARDALVVRGEMLSLEQERALVAERFTSLQSELSGVSRVIETARALLSEAIRERRIAGDFIATVKAERLNAISLAASAGSRMEQADIEYRQVENAHREELERIRASVSLLELSRNNAAQIDERLADLRDHWTRVDPAGDASHTAAWKFRDRADQAERAVHTAEEQLSQIADSYEAWRADTEAMRLEEDLRSRFQLTGTTDKSSLESQLEQAIGAAEQVVYQLRTTQEVALRIADELKEEAERYAESVLQPLSATIQSYSRALMVSADDSLHYRALFRASRSEFRPGVARRGLDGQVETLDRDPNLYFSEGQLSALSVSSLLAASTSFRWSRWPALLMDDPLQHNDVIHASAFIDLMRRLVQKLDYQIILSTHDSDEADFIARKCESAKVPFQLCRLAPTRGHGLIAS
jgi:exonuclease SbcC